MVKDMFPPALPYEDLARVLDFAEQALRPVLVEGVLLLHALEIVGRKPDTLIYVREASATGWFESQFFDPDPDDPNEPYRRLGCIQRPGSKSRTLAEIAPGDSPMHRLAVYHQTFTAQHRADVVVEWPHFQECVAADDVDARGAC
jgi:hypothetical protein